MSASGSLPMSRSNMILNLYVRRKTTGKCFQGRDDRFTPKSKGETEGRDGMQPDQETPLPLKTSGSFSHFLVINWRGIGCSCFQSSAATSNPNKHQSSTYFRLWNETVVTWRRQEAAHDSATQRANPSRWTRALSLALTWREARQYCRLAVFLCPSPCPSFSVETVRTRQ